MDELYLMFDKSLHRISDAKTSNVSDEINPDRITSGASVSSVTQTLGSIQSGKLTFSNNENGYILGLDQGVGKMYVGTTTSYFNFDGTNAILTGGITATSLTIGTSPNWFRADSSGNIWSGADTLANAETTKFAVTNAGVLYATSATISGTISGTSTIGGRLGSTLATAIDSSGHFADSAISTASNTILGSFTFGVSGALQIGTYANGVSGDIKISPTGILGRDSAGATTFSINGTTGVAVLNGLVVGTNVGLGTAQDSAGVTVIVGNVVTTGFVNALNVTAASMSVGGLTAGTINSKSIVLGITGGTGDVEIRAGIATGDFANAGAATGFIIGLDDSDSDKAKYYFGSPTSHVSFDGTNTENVGAANVNTYTYGETIAVGDVLCLKNSYTEVHATHDAYTDDSHPTTVYNNDYIFIKQSADEYDGFIKFDVSAIASDIQRATLRLYHYSFVGTNTTTVGVYLIDGADWDESTITQNTKPTVKEYAEDQLQLALPTVGTWIEFDITNIVRGWKLGTISNYGIKLEVIATDNNGRVGFNSSEVVDYEPHLRVWNNASSDGKLYLAADAVVTEDTQEHYNTVRNIVGIAAEAGNLNDVKKVYDVPGSVIGKSITGVVAGQPCYISDTAGKTVSDPVNIYHLCCIGRGRATGDLLFMPERPYFIERYPINTDLSGQHPNLYTDSTMYLFPPKDAQKAVIRLESLDASSHHNYCTNLIVYRTGATYVEYNVADVGGATPMYSVTWGTDLITVVSLYDGDGSYPRIWAYYYTK